MKKMIAAISLTGLLCHPACRPAPPETFPLPTEICVTTQHHGQPIPDATIYVKYHADTFPGYLQPASYFDAIFKTGKNARSCLAPVPEGRHWLVALGYDSLYYPHEVMGNLPVTISLDGTAKLDTIIYVSEKH